MFKLKNIRMFIYNLSCHSTICHKVPGSVLSLFNYYNCMQDCMFNLSKMCNFHTSPLNTNSQSSFITILLCPFLQPTPASARRMQITFRCLNAYFTWTASYVPDLERDPLALACASARTVESRSFSRLRLRHQLGNIDSTPTPD